MSQLNLNNIQGDILLRGLPKRAESFFFFQIADGHVKDFCRSLKQVAKEITHVDNTAQMRRHIIDGKAERGAGDLVEMAGANITFSWKGLQKVSGSIINYSSNTTTPTDNRIRWLLSSLKTSAALRTVISKTG
jgi:hypothetical protein